ncbi:thiamine pyrophosphokinase [Paracoccus sp. DMF-8]|uniref:thiamine pyrophosphokinase n=1 Tax=Paracoccus sp. DMF-8 TaxID=3019445 RepID=UPI003204A47C
MISTVVSDAARRAIPADLLHPVAEQDSTDFEKCLTRDRRALCRRGRVFGRAAGPCAGRDECAGAPPRAARAAAVGPGCGALRCPAHPGALDLPVGTRLSLFPMGAVSGRSRGPEWPIDGIGFAPDGRIGTSNRVTGPVGLEIDGPMLLILPRKFIQPLARQLFHGMIRPERG